MPIRTILTSAGKIFTWVASVLVDDFNRDLVAMINPANLEFTPSGYCAEKHRLLDDYVKTMRVWALLINEQIGASLAGEMNTTRFDALIHEAGLTKDQAKYAYILHVQDHGCYHGCG